jgi:hypothetical protein
MNSVEYQVSMHKRWLQAPPDEKTDAGLDFFLLLIAAPLLCWKKTFISLTYKLFFF